MDDGRTDGRIILPKTASQKGGLKSDFVTPLEHGISTLKNMQGKKDESPKPDRCIDILIFFISLFFPFFNFFLFIPWSGCRHWLQWDPTRSAWDPNKNQLVAISWLIYFPAKSRGWYNFAAKINCDLTVSRSSSILKSMKESPMYYSWDIKQQGFLFFILYTWSENKQ